MVRSASALLALVVLPSVLRAQQTPATHHVVGGETLWTLAQRYYSDPYQWPRIYEANRSVVENPHWIYPGEDLVIPDAAATRVVEQVTVQPAAPAPAAPLSAPPPAAPGSERTVFYPRSEAAGYATAAAVERSRPAVPRQVFYAAPWLSAEGSGPEHLGSILEFTGAEDEKVPRLTALPFDKLELAFTGPTPARGTQLLAFRVGRVIRDLGTVLIPTGVITVSDAVPGGAVGLVVDVLDRMSVGDLVTALPEFSLQPGVRPAPAPGADATIVAFANDHPLEELNDVAFLDQGSDHGVKIGDEYVLVWTEGTGTPPEPEGRLQVISVHPDHASARIVWLRNPIFQSGLRVRVDRKMP